MEVDALQGVAQQGNFGLVHLFLQAHIVVKIVMLGLVFASVWCWAIILEKYFVVGRARQATERFEQQFWSGQSLEELYGALAAKGTVGMATLFMAAMREWKRSQESAVRAGFQGVQKRIEKVMDVQLQKELARLEVAPSVSGHDRVGWTLHRTVRHGVGNHEFLPRHRGVEEHQSRRRGTGAGGGAFRDGARPPRRHTGDNFLQQIRQ